MEKKIFDIDYRIWSEVGYLQPRGNSSYLEGAVTVKEELEYCNSGYTHFIKDLPYVLLSFSRLLHCLVKMMILGSETLLWIGRF